ncbi:MAG TPA: histidinol-phosphate transaminase [Acidimicrobiales bacterium]|nr:histidinol-phosphate transaminase [Acidimicrobiales bacterium]
MTLPKKTAQVRAELSRMQGYHSKQVDVEVRLNTNESPEAPPRAFAEALAQFVLDAPFHRYPDRAAAELRAAIAEFHGVPRENVFAANGSNEVLQCLLLAFGGRDRSVLVFEPTYALHSHIAHITGTPVTEAARNDDYTLSPDAVGAAVRDADPTITFLCSPNNPTGLVESPEVLDAAVKASHGLVVVDEAYGQFSSWSAVDRVHDDGQVVVVRTFSKTWAMAGLRLGYAIAPANVVAALDAVVLPYHLDMIKQAAGVLAFRFHGEMQARVASIVEERGRILDGLAQLEVDVWPSEANFILFRPRAVDGGDVWERLVDESVLVRDCSTWPGLAGCLRVTVGTPQENGRFLDALGKALIP